MKTRLINLTLSKNKYSNKSLPENGGVPNKQFRNSMPNKFKKIVLFYLLISSSLKLFLGSNSPYILLLLLLLLSQFRYESILTKVFYFLELSMRRP